MNSLWPAICFLAVLLPGMHTAAFEEKEFDPCITIGERFTFYSEELDEDRKILVAFPKGYNESGERYPVLYVLDGEFFFYQAHAAVEFLSECTYIRTHPIPQMIVVGIVNIDRNRDFTPTHAPIQGELRYPTSGGAAKFLRFLKTELIPLIDARYRTQPFRILSGWSFGGLFTVYTYLEKPDTFSAYLAISPSLWWEDDRLVNQAKDVILDPTRPLVVTLGSLEVGDMGRSVRQGFIPILESNKLSSSAFSSIEIAEREHYLSPYEAFYDGLSAFFEGWQLPQERLDGGLESIREFYEELSIKAGYTVEIPESAFQAFIGSLISEGNNQAALEMARLMVDRYPLSSRAHGTLGVMLLRTGDNSAARARFEHAIEVEKQCEEPDSERIMDVWLMLWLMDQTADANEIESN